MGKKMSAAARAARNMALIEAAKANRSAIEIFPCAGHDTEGKPCQNTASWGVIEGDTIMRVYCRSCYLAIPKEH